MTYFLILLYLGFCFLIAHKIGRYKTIGFWPTLILSAILSPVIGFIIAESSRLKNAQGCKWCGNKYNEAEYCGLCGKNDKGDIRPGFIPRTI